MGGEKMTLTEKVARAIATVECQGTWSKDEMDRLWEGYEIHADFAIAAVLDAIAEPSEAVQLAGHNMRSDPVTGLSTSCGVDEIYRAMIAALRKEIEG